MSLEIIIELVKKNRKKVFRSNYYSSVIGRIVSCMYAVIFSLFIYRYMAFNSVNEEFKTYVGTDDYLGYIIVGNVIYSIAISILMAVGRFYMIEMREGTISAILITPTPKLIFLLGSGIEQMERSILEIVTIFGSCFLFNIQVPMISMHETIILLISLFLSLYSMGVMLAFIMLLFRDTYIIQNTLFLFLNILCGISFPVQYLPENIRHISELIPLTHALQFFRNIMYLDFSILNCEKIILKLYFTSLIFLLLGRLFLYKYFEIKGEG